MTALPIRTVFDDRQGRASKYRFQILLLTASWHRNVRNKKIFPLEISVLGKPPEPLLKQLEAWGARLVFSEPHPLDAFCATANKLAAAREPFERHLLVDNDVCFMREPGGLLEGEPDIVSAAIADNERISESQWGRIESALGLPALKRPWTPLVEEFRAACRRGDPQPARTRYWNSGVVVMAASSEFAKLWAGHVQKITEHFENHPDRSRGVCGTDQAGLATAIAAYGRFRDLPLIYNYRPSCFNLGLESPDRIVCLHLVNMKESDGSGPLSAERILRAYWLQQIFRPLAAFPDRGVRGRRLAWADTCLSALLEWAKEYRVGHLLEAAEKCAASSF